jgi:hypothetical protein
MTQEHGASLVTVTINGSKKDIHRGSHTVVELKQLLEIDPTYAIDEDVNGTLTPLDDMHRVTVKGGEIFFAHPRTGGSA